MYSNDVYPYELSTVNNKSNKCICILHRTWGGEGGWGGVFGGGGGGQLGLRIGLTADLLVHINPFLRIACRLSFLETLSISIH